MELSWEMTNLGATYLMILVVILPIAIWLGVINYRQKHHHPRHR